ncbi:MAG: RluA family pseudouridine synthase [Candidatus Aminicenantes bacterium]|nr:RluA family pseudouridine synthase [Candidatus Aminicenantes bacterium]
MEKQFVVPEDEAGQRLDVYLTRRIGFLSRSQVKKLIDLGEVRVNGEVIKAGYRLKGGEIIDVKIKPVSNDTAIEPENIPLNLIYVDDDIIVINKPAGLIVHPGAGQKKGTLVNALLYHFPEIATVGPIERPGIVHRLDAETSGVMVVARSAIAYKSLQRQFKNREVDKTYLGIVWGKFSQKGGKIEWAIGRHPHDRQRFSVRTRHPKEAITVFSVLHEGKDFSVLEIKPITGRTHQIRVHLAAAGHPIIGDRRYGRRDKRGSRLFLHARRLAFIHPTKKVWMEFESPIPDEFRFYWQDELETREKRKA